MNRNLIALAMGAVALLAVGAFAFWPTGEDSGGDAEPIEAGDDGSDRVVKRFRPLPDGSNGRQPSVVDGIPLKPRSQTPLETARAEAVPVLGPELVQRVDTFLDRQLDPVIPPEADAQTIHQLYRADFKRITMDFGGLEQTFKVMERDATGDDYRETRLARATVRAALADKVEQVPPPPTMPLPQHATYRTKLYGRAEDIRNEARELLDELLEDDPGAAAAVAELKAAIDDASE